MSVAQMRSYLIALYPRSDAWRVKVETMSEAQVCAFYFRSIGR